jgi:hypothetical protein
MKTIIRNSIPFILVLLASCSRPGNNYITNTTIPVIFPDYCEVTIPSNIAPLNFKLLGDAGRIYVLFKGVNNDLGVYGNRKIRIPVRSWHKFLDRNIGDTISVEVFARQKEAWTRFKSFNIYVKEEKADPWLVYRLIAPGYESWSEMGIYQREISTFKVLNILNNKILPGTCMNCHSFRANSPDGMVFHLRGSIGATMLIRNGEVIKLNTKTAETISNCIYPNWHPSGDYIAFSVNNISQVFHSVKEKRIEVFDSRSDLVIYDIANNKLITSKLISSDQSFETFPAFSPDGKRLFFCTAEKKDMPDDFDKIKYSLCSISFDPANAAFGSKVDTILSSGTTGKSISFPRVSPDGRFMVFTLSDYGNFSIWHREADLYQLNLETGEFKAADALNSQEAESYHSWSSNSRWMVFSSRRTDGLYTQPFLAYLDENGNFSKPLMLPQKDPDFYFKILRSFNVPEFITARVDVKRHALFKSVGSPSKNVNFEIAK